MGTLLSVLIFLGKFLRKKAYILCVHIEGRIVGSRKRGSRNKGVRIGVRIEVRIERISKEGQKRGVRIEGISKRGVRIEVRNRAYTLGVLIERISFS